MSWLPKKTVLCPIDFSKPASTHALESALQLVSKPQDVHLLYVTPTPPPMVLTYGDVWYGPTPEQRLQKAIECLARFAKEHNATEVTQIVREGDAGTVIADYASECHAELIVIPSHGYHGVKRFFLGSVTERVLRHAPCEVLVLRQTA